MSNENDEIDEVFNFYFIVEPEKAEIVRSEEDEKRIPRVMRRIEKKYINGIKSFGTRMFKIIDDENLELYEINLDFKGDLTSRLNFGIFEIGGGVGTSISFKLKKK